jgi:hypothetical protein
MLAMPLSRLELRALLQELLPTDADFVRFVGDHFPETCSRFGDSMDRINKTNLLLACVDLQRLTEKLRTEKLRQLNAERPDAEVPELPKPRAAESGTSAPPPSTNPAEGSRFAQAWMISTLIVLVVGSLVGVGLWLHPAEYHDRWRIARRFVDFAQWVAVVIACSRLLYEWVRTPAVCDKWSKRLMRRFSSAWAGLWLGWVAIYSMHLVREIYEDGPGKRTGVVLDPEWRLGANVVANCLHNTQSAMLFVIFAIMYFDVKTKPAYWRKWALLALGTCALFAVLHAIVLMVSYEAVPLNSGGFTVDPISKTVDFIMALWTGIVAAACMGMFVGRLGSAFLDVHIVEFVILYCYAGTQPLFPVLRAYYVERALGHEATILDLCLKLLALGLKIGLYFIIHKRITKGGIALYMRRQQALCRATPEDWERLERDTLKRQR